MTTLSRWRLVKVIVLWRHGENLRITISINEWKEPWQQPMSHDMGSVIPSWITHVPCIKKKGQHPWKKSYKNPQDFHWTLEPVPSNAHLPSPSATQTEMPPCTQSTTTSPSHTVQTPLIAHSLLKLQRTTPPTVHRLWPWWVWHVVASIVRELSEGFTLFMMGDWLCFVKKGWHFGLCGAWWR